MQLYAKSQANTCLLYTSQAIDRKRIHLNSIIMRNYYLTLLLICICGLCFAQQQTNDISTKNPPNKEWNFNNLDGWKYGHQDNNPDNQCILENGYLRIFTRANSCLLYTSNTAVAVR